MRKKYSNQVPEPPATVDPDGLTAALAALVRAQIDAALPTAKPSDTVLLTIKEVCARTKLARSTVYELVKIGALPVVRIGHRVYVKETDLARFISERTTYGDAT
jgi:excisionase family DNA binding protein